MESLLNAEQKDNHRNDLRESLCYYLSIILVLVAFIASSISLGFCNAATIQSKIYNYEFPTWDFIEDLKAGTPVSLTGDGKAVPGAGTTIYRNITLEQIHRDMHNVKIRELDFHLAMVVYDGGIDAYQFIREGYAVSDYHVDLKPTLKGEIRQVDDVVRISRRHFIVVGSRELLPLHVDISHDNHKISCTFNQGQPLSLPNDDDYWPHIDNLSNTTFALIYENGDYLYTRFGEWKGDGVASTLSLGAETKATNRYEYHGIAGMDDKHFIITATGRQWGMNHTAPIVTACLCTVKDDKSIEFGEWKWLAFTMSHNYFDMDNMGPDKVIMVFADGETAGINAVVIEYEREQNNIFFGSHEVIQNGGAIFRETRIDLRVIDRDRFAIFYEDNAIHNLVLVLGELSTTNDIVMASPKFVINRPQNFMDRAWYFYDLCELDRGGFALVEFIDSRDRKDVFIHRGDILPRPFGIVTSVNKRSHKLMVQFAGMVKIKSQTFTPGRAIFTNSKGELLEGNPYGYANRDFGTFYETLSDNSIVSENNIVGMAVTKNKIYMKFY